MEPINLSTLSVDSRGVVRGIEGDTARFGIDSQIIGQSWSEVFRAWDLGPLPLIESDSYPCRLRTANPAGRSVSIELMRLRAGEDAEPCIIAVFRDEELSALTDQQQRLCSVGEISAIVAHEINNALTLLTGWLDLIGEDLDEDDPHLPTLQLLMGEAMRIGTLTRNLLDVRRASSEATTALDLRGVLDEVLSFVQHQMEKHDIEVESRIAPELPAIRGSSGRIKQALLNLLVNADQAMPSGGRLTVVAEPDGKGHVRVAVEDTGCGIPADAFQRVFSPFFTTKRDGTGLGLPVTRRIIEDHSGTVHLESRPGKGTRFTLRLPVEAAQCEPRKAPSF